MPKLLKIILTAVIAFTAFSLLLLIPPSPFALVVVIGTYYLLKRVWRKSVEKIDRTVVD